VKFTKRAVLERVEPAERTSGPPEHPWNAPVSGEQEIADEVPAVHFAERIERDEPVRKHQAQGCRPANMTGHRPDISYDMAANPLLVRNP
jgi:hypothetical protein